MWLSSKHTKTYQKNELKITVLSYEWTFFPVFRPLECIEISSRANNTIWKDENTSSSFPSSNAKKEMGSISVRLIQKENMFPCSKGFYHIRNHDHYNSISITCLFCTGKGVPNILLQQYYLCEILIAQLVLIWH